MKIKLVYGVEFVEVDVLKFGLGEVFIKVFVMSICGIDFYIYEWNEWV